MRKGLLVTTAALLLAACASEPGGDQEAALNDGRCADGAAAYICGPVNAEDLVRVPGTPWVLASQMAGPGVAAGSIALLDARSGRWRALDLDAIPARPEAPYADCPAPPTAAAFSGHGIALAEAGGAPTLLAINHAGPERVELFRVEARGDEVPALSWIGCVVAPETAFLNSVAPLPGGGFAATKFFDPTNPDWGEDAMAGRPTGLVLEWSPEEGWRALPGTELSGPNGIAVTADGSRLFVAAWGGRTVQVFARGGPEGEPRRLGVLETAMHPDNLRWDEEGRLLVTGQTFDDPAAFAACHLGEDRVCTFPFQVLRVDPVTLAAETVVDWPGSPVFGSASTALDLGTEYWIGTTRGDRILRVAKE